MIDSVYAVKAIIGMAVVTIFCGRFPLSVLSICIGFRYY